MVLNVILFGTIADLTNWTQSNSSLILGGSQAIGLIALIFSLGILFLFTKSIELTFLFMLPITWVLVTGGVLSVVAGIIISVIMAGFLLKGFLRLVEY